MKVETFIDYIKQAGIETIAGVPDSLLSQFCDYLNNEGADEFQHYVPANEGAAVGIGAGSFIASGKPAMIYMQNSGIGNTINPIASLIHKDVYDIPMLFLVGFRGEPGKHDEPQHVYQGKVTCQLCIDMEIAYSIIDKDSDSDDLKEVFQKVMKAFSNNEQYAIIVCKDTFDKRSGSSYQNEYTMVRESAIHSVLKEVGKQAMIVSTTGKISREVYEQSDLLYGTHQQCFLTVGSMGHASMIAFAMAKQRSDKKVICLDGDGAALMHMGSLAFLGNQKPLNLVHIILNNAAHESVGGMPTGAPGQSFAQVAKACGYPHVIQVSDSQSLEQALDKAMRKQELSLIEVMVKQGSRSDLGRPKETPIENKHNFMNYHKEEI